MSHISHEILSFTSHHTRNTNPQSIPIYTDFPYFLYTRGFIIPRIRLDLFKFR